MRPMLRRGVLALVVLGLLAAILVPAAVPAIGGIDRASATSGLTFKVGVLAGPAAGNDALNLASDPSALASEVWTLQYPRLTEYDAADATPSPGLAESWSPSADLLTYTYQLRRGMTWSDGTPITSADVVASIDAARRGHWPGTGDLSGLSARATGPLTVVVHTTTLDRQLPSLPVHITPGGATGKLSVGSGPFVVWQRKPGFIQMVANDRYYGGRPLLDAVEFQVFPNGAALNSAIESGNVDAASGIPSSYLNDLNGNERINTVIGNLGDYYALSLDTRAAGLTDARARQAIGYFIDRALLVERENHGVGRAALTPTLARSTAWDFDVKEREQVEQTIENNSGEASNLLKAAGVGTINLSVALPSDDPAAPQVLRALGEVLRGTPVHVTQATAGDANARLVLRKPTDDPGTILRAFTCSADRSWWCNAGYQQMYTRESTDLDLASRTDTVLAMKRLLIAQSPEIPLFHDDLLEAYRNDRWKNVVTQPTDEGPAFFSISAPSFVLVQPATQFGTNKVGAQRKLLAGLAFIALIVLALVALFVLRARRSSPGRRSPLPVHGDV